MSDRLDRLWAGWRLGYVSGAEASPAAAPPDGSGSLFERLLRLDDAEAFVVHRGELCAAMLNAYPYTNGHLMVLPKRAVAELSALNDDEHTELWEMTRAAVAALEAAYHCDGVNVGMNIGKASGAGVPDHLHVHVLPRWAGDTNFMTSVAETRVMPEPLGDSWQRLREAWPR